MSDRNNALAKVHAAMAEAAEEAARRELSAEDAMQFLADYLLGHPDADVREFQLRHERQHRRDLS